MKLAVLITNPNHHFEMTKEVAELALSKSHEVMYVSLCEMRRMASPIKEFKKMKVGYAKFGELSKQLKPNSGKKTLGGNNSVLRNILRLVFWRLKLRSFIAANLGSVDKVLLMNDTAYPGNYITSWLKKKGIPFYLLQEGIRFELPNEKAGKYGAAGSKKLFTWGERSKRHFSDVISNGSEVVVSGSPRFNKFLKEVNEKVSSKNQTRVLGLFSNPIDDQGFCSPDEKMAIFDSFLERASEYLDENDISLGLKCHPREDANEYLQLAQLRIKNVFLLPSNIFEALEKVDAGIVIASTVGLELLAAGKALAQMEIPAHGYVFDYTDHPGLVKIPAHGQFDLDSLFSQEVKTSYFEEHIAKLDSVRIIYESMLD